MRFPLYTNTKKKRRVNAAYEMKDYFLLSSRKAPANPNVRLVVIEVESQSSQAQMIVQLNDITANISS